MGNRVVLHCHLRYACVEECAPGVMTSSSRTELKSVSPWHPQSGHKVAWTKSHSENKCVGDNLFFSDSSQLTCSYPCRWLVEVTAMEWGHVLLRLDLEEQSVQPGLVDLTLTWPCFRHMGSLAGRRVLSVQLLRERSWESLKLEKVAVGDRWKKRSSKKNVIRWVLKSSYFQGWTWGKLKFLLQMPGEDRAPGLGPVALERLPRTSGKQPRLSRSMWMCQQSYLLGAQEG